MNDKNEKSITIWLKNSKGEMKEHIISEITHFENNGNDASLFKTKEPKQFVYGNLKQLKKRPELKFFARISPQNLVNTDFYEAFDKITSMCTFCFKKEMPWGIKENRFQLKVTRNGKTELNAMLFITRGEGF